MDCTAFCIQETGRRRPRSYLSGHSLLLCLISAGIAVNSKLIVVCTNDDVGGDGLGKLTFLTHRIQGFLDQLMFNYIFVSSTPSR